MEAFVDGNNIKFTYKLKDGYSKIKGAKLILIQMEFPESRAMIYYTLRDSEFRSAPATWDLQGSNDDIEFVIIQSYVKTSWTFNVEHVFTVDTAHIPYKYWRLLIKTRIPHHQNTYASLDEVVFYTNSQYELGFTSVASDFKSLYGWDTNEGWKVNASSNSLAFLGFDKTQWEGGNYWKSADNTYLATTKLPVGEPQWISIKYPLPVRIKYFIISTRTGDNSARPEQPRDFTLQGSNNASSWIDLQSYTDQFGMSAGESRTFGSISETHEPYLYFRILITKNKDFLCNPKEKICFISISSAKLRYLNPLLSIKIAESASTRELP
jgi:hypothetical protein